MIKKICKTCNTEKTLDLFPIGKNYKYGVRPNCKLCHNIINKEKYYDTDRQRVKYLENRESKLKKVKEYNTINRNNKLEYLKIYREKDKNKEKRREDYLIRVIKFSSFSYIEKATLSSGYLLNNCLWVFCFDVIK